MWDEHADELTMELQNEHQCHSVSESGTYKNETAL